MKNNRVAVAAITLAVVALAVAGWTQQQAAQVGRYRIAAVEGPMAGWSLFRLDTSTGQVEYARSSAYATQGWVPVEKAEQQHAKE